MASVLNNIANNKLSGMTPAEINKWYYLILFIAIILFFFLYVDVNIWYGKNNQNQQAKTDDQPVPTTTRMSGTGEIFHTKITKMESSLEDQHKEMQQQFYS